MSTCMEIQHGFWSVMGDPAFPRNSVRSSSSHFTGLLAHKTHRNAVGDSVSPSAKRSSSSTGGGSGANQHRALAVPFSSNCPWQGKNEFQVHFSMKGSYLSTRSQLPFSLISSVCPALEKADR